MPPEAASDNLIVPPETLSADDGRPPVGIFCPTYLKPEMLHVDRQVTGLRRVRPKVLAFKRENQARFPFEPVTLIPRSHLRWARRIWNVQIRKTPQMAFPSEVRALTEAVRASQCRLVHIYFGNNGIFWLPWIRSASVPTIVSFHGADVRVDLGSTRARQLLKELTETVSKVLVRSVSLGDTLIQIGCSPEKIAVQRTGIPLEEYPGKTRSEAENGEWNLLQACRLIPKKGLEKTIEAFALFHRQWPRATLTLAGDGPLRTVLEEKVAAMGLQSRVDFKGFLSPEQLREAYYSSHFFLHPSGTTSSGDREGIPNSLLEAMATGLPCIATAHGGIPEAIESRHSGMLVPETAGPDEIAECLFELVRDPGLRQLVGINASEVVRQKFDLKTQITNLENIYLKALRP